VLYLAGRILPGPLKWAKYFCPATTALVNGGFGRRLRHVAVSAFLIGALFHASEALSYFLFIGTFSLAFDWNGPTPWRSANLVFALLLFSLGFTGWILVVPRLYGFSFQEAVSALMLPKYSALKRLLDLCGMSRGDVESLPVEPGAAAVAFLCVGLFLMLHACNVFALARLRDVFKRYPRTEGPL
jgi:hypothetical protein